MTVQLHTLKNGLRVVTEFMPGLQSAAVGVWVNAGGRHEAPDQNGIAHFLEHMAFKGTKRRSALQIAEEIEDVGGYINAYTSREVTAYYARVLKDDVPLAMDLISDILLNPVFDPREIEVERGVILQEIGQALDTPDDIIFDWLQEVAYPEQPLGRTILGPVDRVKAFDKPDLQRFVAEHYGPGQMILSAAGAVDHDQIVRLAEAAFGHLPAVKVSSALPGVLSWWRAAGSQTARTGAFHAGAGGPRLPVRRYLHRADLRHGPWRRHVLSAVPGNPRKAGPVLHDLQPGRGLWRYRADDDLCGDRR